MWGSGISVNHGVIEWSEFPFPPEPGPGQVLVAVEAAGVGPWDDLVRQGGWDVGLRPPAALGVEGTGRVVAVGPGVTTVSVGDAVLAHEAPLPGGGGFWAERVLLTAAHVASRPPGLDAVAAAALPVGGLTAAQALEAVQLTPGDRLFVTGGAGGTGVLVVQLAARAGLHVTATASPSSTPRLRRLGAETVIDYHDPHGLEHADGPFDAAVVAAVGTAAAALRVVRDGGRLCSLTSDAPPAQRDITTSSLYVRPDGQELARLADTLTDGTLEVQPEVLPLQDGGAALTRVLAARTRGRKLVLCP